ncbi:hypothetical protein K5X82_01110 [Halosquirtibacter xylanolyticus]|uniref:hypothetical protein n=1 Tax=Halosquirtibacter xylanolyticus TaxID=3374599 RepID=UPI003749EA5C|nr:hypothetical protein K5X82_01110 [Prolixibacteraceae bacterium]
MNKKIILYLWGAIIICLISISESPNYFIHTKTGQFVTCRLLNQGLTFKPKGKNRDTLTAKGYIYYNSVSDFKCAIKKFPKAKTLILDTIPGSFDQNQSIILGNMIRVLNMNTVIPKDGIVYGCGINLFLAGNNRMVHDSCCIKIPALNSRERLTVTVEEQRNREQQEYYYQKMGLKHNFIEYIEENQPLSQLIITAKELKNFLSR